MVVIENKIRSRRAENVRTRINRSAEFRRGLDEMFKQKAIENLSIVERKRRSLNEQVHSRSMSKFGILLSIFGMAFVLRMVQRPFMWIKLLY